MSFLQWLTPPCCGISPTACSVTGTPSSLLAPLARPCPGLPTTISTTWVRIWHEAAAPHQPTDSPSCHWYWLAIFGYKTSVRCTDISAVCVVTFLTVSSRTPLAQGMWTPTVDNTLTAARSQGRIRSRHLCFLSTWLKTTWLWPSSRCFWEDGWWWSSPSPLWVDIPVGQNLPAAAEASVLTSC